MCDGPRAGVKTERGTPTPLRQGACALLTPPLIRPVPFHRTRPRMVRGQTKERNIIMKEDTKTGRKPTYEIFAVKDGVDGKAVWTKIGAAWPHKDGKGFSLKGFTINGDPCPDGKNSVHLRVIEAKGGKGGVQ